MSQNTPEPEHTPRLPRREAFFAALHEALRENAKLKTKEQSLALGYLQALMETPAYIARYMETKPRRLSASEAKEQGEALVEKCLLSRLPQEVSGQPPLRPDAATEEAFAVASVLLHRKFARIVTGMPYGAKAELTRADDSPASRTLENKHYDRRGFMTRATLGAAALGFGSYAVTGVLKKEMKAWLFDRAGAEQQKRVKAMQTKLASGKPITGDDLKKLDMEEVVKDTLTNSDPDTDDKLGQALAKSAIAAAAAVVAGGKLIHHLCAYRGSTPDRVAHDHSLMLLDVSRKLDGQARAVYDRIPAEPSPLPEAAVNSPG